MSCGWTKSSISVPWNCLPGLTRSVNFVPAPSDDTGLHSNTYRLYNISQNNKLMPSITDVMKNTRVYLLWPVTPQLPSRSCNVTHHQVSTNTTSLKQYMAPSLKSVLHTTEVGNYALKYHYDITRSSKLLRLNYMPDFHLAHPSTSTKIINTARWVHSPLDQVPQGEQLAWTTHSGYIYHYAGNENDMIDKRL